MVRLAAAAVRRARVAEALLSGLALAGVGVFLTSVWLEFSSPEGLLVAELPPQVWWLLCLPAAVVAALFRPLDPDELASELDRRAGLGDRLGTAREFRSSTAPLVDLQRENASLAASRLEPAAHFRPDLARGARRVAAAWALCLVGVGLGLTLSPLAPPPDSKLSAGDRLLEEVRTQRDWYDRLGDKEAVGLLEDLERTVRRIQAREEELIELLERRKELQAEAPLVEAEEQPVPEPELESDGLVSLEDLERLEKQLSDALRLDGSQEASLVSELFLGTQKAKKLGAAFEEMHREEVHHSFESGDTTTWTGNDSGSSVDELNNQGKTQTGNSALDSRLPDRTENPAEDQMDLIRRDLSEEAQVEHDSVHDQQQSFHQFLQEFVKEVQQMVADKATGRSRSRDGEVQVNDGSAVADKTNAMAESGFEEMGDTRRRTSQPPPEGLPGAPESISPAGKGEQASSPQTLAMAGQGDGQTSAGASGAGRNLGSEGGALASLLRNIDPGLEGPLEQVLSQLAAGRLPPEQRDELFDRLAKHSVHAGTGDGEVDGLMSDYFSAAEELIISNRDTLPPLFRDYAHSYFDEIRPAADSGQDSAD